MSSSWTRVFNSESASLRTNPRLRAADSTEAGTGTLTAASGVGRAGAALVEGAVGAAGPRADEIRCSSSDISGTLAQGSDQGRAPAPRQPAAARCDRCTRQLAGDGLDVPGQTRFGLGLN